MEIFPAIDLKNGNVVRLLKGDYNQMTVYSDDPLCVADGFLKCNAKYLHVVDLDGAKDGTNPNFSVIENLAKNTPLKIQVGGGIRSEDIIYKYINAGVFRVILGTIAITDSDFLKSMVSKYKDKIAVGVDLKDGYVATHGWTQVSKTSCNDFCHELENIGVKTIICTDISKDGAMQGTNIELYKELNDKFNIDIIASGGVSSISDIKSLANMNLYGAILGKALYTNSVDLSEAIRCGKIGSKI